LLAVWSELEQEISRDWSLVLAGGTGASGVFAAEPLLADMPKVIYTGYVEDELLPALISGADAFIYPSLYEGFGLPVLEAMACEVAVISSNATSLPEVTGEDGALLVSPTDSVAIGKAIRSVIDDKQMRIRLGHAGGRRAAKFSWDRCAAETESLLLREAAVRKAFFSREETA
jgi:alpha-1,3-rhamnosyl/mannosyltransferase